MYAILSVMVGVIGNGTKVWADLYLPASGDSPSKTICFSAEKIFAMIPFGHRTDPEHQMLAILNYQLKQGFELGPISTYRSSRNRNSPEITHTHYYLKMQPE